MEVCVSKRRTDQSPQLSRQDILECVKAVHVGRRIAERHPAARRRRQVEVNQHRANQRQKHDRQRVTPAKAVRPPLTTKPCQPGETASTCLVGSRVRGWSELPSFDSWGVRGLIRLVLGPFRLRSQKTLGKRILLKGAKRVASQLDLVLLVSPDAPPRLLDENGRANILLGEKREESLLQLGVFDDSDVSHSQIITASVASRLLFGIGSG